MFWVLLLLNLPIIVLIVAINLVARWWRKNHPAAPKPERELQYQDRLFIFTLVGAAIAVVLSLI